jgi:hypothetical protein
MAWAKIWAWSCGATVEAGVVSVMSEKLQQMGQ